MKIYFFLSLLMTFFTSDTPAPIVEEGMIVETTGVGFGRPTNACDGIGICVVSSDFHVGELQENWGMAELTFGKRGAVTSIHVDRASLTRKTIKKQFSQDNFIMLDSYTGKLKLGGKNTMIKIPAGKHRLTKTKKGFLIEVSG